MVSVLYADLLIINLDSTSILAFGNLNNQLIFSNKNKLFVLDENYNQIISKSFKDNIIDIEILNEYIAVKTNSKIILLKENEIVKGTPLNYDGNCSVRSISDDSKIDILLTRKKILYNYPYSKSFKYPFDSLPTISILSPKDNSFRIFNWILRKDNGE